MSSTLIYNEHRQILLREIHRLGLERHTEELDRLGYTILDQVAPLEFITSLRQQCALALDSGNGVQTAMLLRRGGVFEEAVCLPKVCALAEYMVGKGCLLSQVTSLRKSQVGSGRHELEIGLHSDLVGIREPFAEYPQLITAVFALDDWTEGAGGSTMVPGSHVHRCHPDPSVPPQGLITLQMPKGSVAIWNGALHHGNSPRRIAGDRVTLHVTYSRAVLRTWEDYTDIARKLELDGRKDTVLGSLLGLHDPFGKNDEHGQRRENVRKIFEWFRS